MNGNKDFKILRGLVILVSTKKVSEVKSLSPVRLFEIPWTVAHQASTKKSSLKCCSTATNSRDHHAHRYSSEQEVLIKCKKKKKKQATINSVCIIINMTLPSVPAPQPYTG